VSGPTLNSIEDWLSSRPADLNEIDADDIIADFLQADRHIDALAVRASVFVPGKVYTNSMSGIGIAATIAGAVFAAPAMVAGITIFAVNESVRMLNNAHLKEIEILIVRLRGYKKKLRKHMDD